MRNRISSEFGKVLLGAVALGQFYLLWRFALSAGNGSGSPIQLLPLNTIQNQLRMIFESSVAGAKLVGATQLMGNLLLIAPIGVLLAGWTRARFLIAALVAAGSSTLIEIYQWMGSTGRTSDIDDVILNSAGCLLLFASTRMVLRLLRPSPTAEE